MIGSTVLRGRTVSMNMLRIVSSNVVFGVVVFIFPVFFVLCTEPSQPLKAVVEFLNYTLITAYKTNTPNHWQL